MSVLLFPRCRLSKDLGGGKTDTRWFEAVWGVEGRAKSPLFLSLIKAFPYAMRDFRGENRDSLP